MNGQTPNQHQPIPPLPAGDGPKSTYFTLPPDQLAKARSRLSWLTFMFACMCIVGVAMEEAFEEMYPHRISVVYVFNFFTSILIFGACRFKRLSDWIVLNLGLVYEVLMCLSVTMGFTWAQYQLSGRPPALTWICVVIVAFPLIIPTKPTRTLIASIIAALMAPVGLLLLSLSGLAQVRPFDYIDASISPLLCALLAFLGARVIYGLNIEVARARQMGSYQLEDLLGKGGMGEVWRASHWLLARPAAIKLVRPEVLGTMAERDSERMLERFKREAQATASLESQHTVSLFDFGRTDEGVFYYVMELLSGWDLEMLIRKFGPLPPERVIHILLQACHSLQEAHGAGLIHRDIKPANLILCHQHAGDFDFVKLLDFGLVALRETSTREDSRLTVEGQVTGTPAYMAPETVAEEMVDQRADLYALGCVAYWMLTGQTLFERETSMKTIIAHVQEAPVPPSRRTELEIPDELENIVLDCLEKKPGKRPQTAGALAQRLTACQTKLSWTPAQAGEWWEIHGSDLGS